MERGAGRRIAGVVAGVLLAWPAVVHGGSLGVRWDRSPGATGYRVRYGTSPDRTDRTVEVGSAREVVLHGLTDCQYWYVSVVAYNLAGESAPSTPVASWPRPTIASIEPRRLVQGDRADLSVTGTNFSPGLVVAVDDPGLTLDVGAWSCSQLALGVTAEPLTSGRRPAAAGTQDLRVSTPEGLMTAAPFEVLLDPARFDVSASVPSTDGRIDGVDVVWVARRFGGREGDGLYDPDFDFDGNGWIDGEELALLGANLGRCWDGSAWTVQACPDPPEDAP